MKDGLDIVFIAVDNNCKRLYFSGANNPLYIVKKMESSKINLLESKSLSTYQLIELSPDKMPVGFHAFMKPFSQQTYTLEKGDLLYLTSDGFCDQFGGNDGKKFMRKRFKELLIEAAALPITAQCDFLKQKFLDWKGDSPQTDDISVLGWEIG